LTEAPTDTRDPGGRKLRQTQRYNERGIRKWKRRKTAAMSDKEKSYAQSKITEWQGKQKDLIDSTDDLKRLYYREQIETAH